MFVGWELCLLRFEVRTRSELDLTVSVKSGIKFFLKSTFDMTHRKV